MDLYLNRQIYAFPCRPVQKLTTIFEEYGVCLRFPILHIFGHFFLFWNKKTQKSFWYHL